MGETAAIIAFLLAYAARLAEPHLAPALARRMRYNRKRTTVVTCIPFFIPRVYVRNAKIRTICFNIQSCYHSISFIEIDPLVASQRMAMGLFALFVSL